MPHLRDITDRAELASLVSQLGRWLDTGDDKEGRAIFHEDAIIHSARGGATGIDDILDYSRRTSDDNENSQHLITDVLVELDGDRATMTANELVAYFPSRQVFPPLLRLVGLRFAFQALRTQDGWRLTRVEVTPLWRQEA
ncbi:SnoaL-like domain-containing protein [Frankia sp. AiPs1]|uniref:nuclear transport factor 2 family protein n=1 Tax=Frankia sp. AiPa1 TaxID=573492 RepID=UPI00202B7CD3|nr:nuclear transport factor 2 family protein [Frankia sp. AiPa1]MCL9758860.1 nuclear transport factor 2 family protein [Frankia sp. AiPa1]